MSLLFEPGKGTNRIAPPTHGIHFGRRFGSLESLVHCRAGTLSPATVSISVSTCPEHGGTPEALLRMADQALYRAKQLGRNKVASAKTSFSLPTPDRPRRWHDAWPRDLCGQSRHNCGLTLAPVEKSR
ncbi:MAG: GGDEF domain-containing protein [Rhodanobacteraceae bacterium]